jgi:hypothetical protein
LFFLLHPQLPLLYLLLPLKNLRLNIHHLNITTSFFSLRLLLPLRGAQVRVIDHGIALSESFF